MGIGSDNVFEKKVSKGDSEYNHYFLKSNLTTSDISGATCKLNSDGSYSVTINIKDGNSYTAGGSGDKYYAPLDKSGIAAGPGDKGYWDHKTAQNVYAAIGEYYSSVVIDEKYNGATINATIDKDGNLKDMTAKFNLVFDISNILGSSGHATGTTTVTFKF